MRLNKIFIANNLLASSLSMADLVTRDEGKMSREEKCFNDLDPR